jgi:hypothetical protein
VDCQLGCYEEGIGELRIGRLSTEGAVAGDCLGVDSAKDGSDGAFGKVT